MPILLYKLSLCSKLAYGGGGGQKLAKSCLRSLWMVPKRVGCALVNLNRSLIWSQYMQGQGLYECIEYID